MQLKEGADCKNYLGPKTPEMNCFIPNYPLIIKVNIKYTKVKQASCTSA